MSKRQVVGSISDKAFRVLGTFLKKARKDPMWIERLEKMLSGQNPFEPIKTVVAIAKNWLQVIVNRERQCHDDFFGEVYPLAEFTRTLKKYKAETIERWKKLGLEPHFFPDVSMMVGDDYRGWKIKPGPWFYQQLVLGNISQVIRGELTRVTAINLGGITVLVDTRRKPRFGDMYENDWLSGIIAKLRETGKIQDLNPRSSRFGVSAEETELIKVEAAQFLGLNPDQLRLEREIEANVIPQMYPHMLRTKDGATNTWEWREEFFGGRGSRLGGGDSDDGGLACVSYDSVSGHWSYRAFRFLAVL